MEYFLNKAGKRQIDFQDIIGQRGTLIGYPTELRFMGSSYVNGVLVINRGLAMQLARVLEHYARYGVLPESDPPEDVIPF